jgi:hypothetical protein
MASRRSRKPIFEVVSVYLDLKGVPIQVGKLWSRSRNGRETMSFEYHSDWLKITLSDFLLIPQSNCAMCVSC